MAALLFALLTYCAIVAPSPRMRRTNTSRLVITFDWITDSQLRVTQIGTLNGLFVLGRSIGFIGHHLDQKRLRAPLYRHPADDIFINMADVSQPRVLGKMQ